MSLSKKKHILTSNIISEKRYLESKKIINEEGSGTTATNLQNLESEGVKIDDSETHETILKQMENTPLRSNITNLRGSVGTSDFFNKLNNIVQLTPEKSSKFDRHLPQNQRSLTGEVITLNLPNGVKLSGTYDLINNKPSDFKISKDVNIGKQNVNLSLKTDTLTGGKTTQFGVKIPLSSK
jgi:hypothetical protein